MPACACAGANASRPGLTRCALLCTKEAAWALPKAHGPQPESALVLRPVFSEPRTELSPNGSAALTPPAHTPYT